MRHPTEKKYNRMRLQLNYILCWMDLFNFEGRRLLKLDIRIICDRFGRNLAKQVQSSESSPGLRHGRLNSAEIANPRGSSR